MIVVHNMSLKALGETFEARASEWMLTGATLSLALVFFINESMFYALAFEGLRDIISNRLAWAAIFFVVGLTRLVVLLINGAYWRTPHLRALTAFLCAGVWFLISAAFARNGSVLIAVVPWIFFLDVYNAKRAAREAGKSEYTQRYLNKARDQANAGILEGTHT